MARLTHESVQDSDEIYLLAPAGGNVKIRDELMDIKVLQDVSFDVEPGVIFGLVGPNGAGNTSLFNCISGHYKPSSGSISIDGTEVSGSAPSRMARLGLARTF